MRDASAVLTKYKTIAQKGIKNISPNPANGSLPSIIPQTVKNSPAAAQAAAAIIAPLRGRFLSARVISSFSFGLSRAVLSYIGISLKMAELTS